MNGYMHIINDIIYPKWIYQTASSILLDSLLSSSYNDDDNLDSFMEQYNTSIYVTLFKTIYPNGLSSSTNNEYTIFVPSNNAFYNEFDLDIIDSLLLINDDTYNIRLIADLVNNHIVEGIIIPSIALFDEQYPILTMKSGITVSTNITFDRTLIGGVGTSVLIETLYINQAPKVKNAVFQSNNNNNNGSPFHCPFKNEPFIEDLLLFFIQ